MNSCVILAGGSGKRMRGVVKDKVLVPLLGVPVILHSFNAFFKSGEVGRIVFVCRDAEQREEIEKELKNRFPNSNVEIMFAKGGKERGDSVLNGLKKARGKSVDIVFIHDGARPFVGSENIKRLARCAEKSGGAVLASRVTDTIKRAPKNMKSACKLVDLERKRLWAMQTPQVFDSEKIFDAYKRASESKLSFTDDVAVFASVGGKTEIVENFSPNPKSTAPEDIALAEFMASRGLLEPV